MNESIRTKTIGNLGYNTLTRLLTFSLSAGTGIVLARHLSADDYGIVGFATIFIGFLQQFNDLGITSSVIQKENVRDEDLYTAFFLKIILGFLIFVASFGWGALSQKVFNNPAVKAVIIVLAFGPFIDSLGSLPTLILKRQLEFKKLTIPQIGSQIAYTFVAIAAVYLGFRYWSIVFASVAATATSVAIVFTLCPAPFKFQWDKRAASEHLKFGSHLFVAGLMVFVLFNADNFVVGAVRGAAALGFYAIAFNWGSKASGVISDVIHGILLSTFSRVQQDKERLKRGFLTILEYVSFGAVLANMMLLILSKELLILVLGGGTSKWLPALCVLEILCVYGVIRAILDPVGILMVSVGRPSLILKSNSIVTGLQVVSLYPAVRYLGIEGVAAVVTVSYALQFLVYVPVLGREMGIPFSAVLHSLLPAILSGGMLAASGFALDRLIVTSWFSVILKTTVGLGLYVVTYGLITRWRILKDGMEIIGTVLGRPSQSSV